jgi:hypothetical protein
MTWRKREIMDMAQDAGWDAHHAEFDTRIEEFAKLVREEQQTEVQRLIALVRAQQITIDKLEAALAQPEQEPVALQMDVIVVNLVREGINKHRARELAEHFIKHITPPQRTEQEPVAFPRQAGDSTWIIDTAFIWRVKHTIDPNTPYDWTPSEEQIETVLLALEKIPSPLYTTPPQRTWVGITDEERNTITRHHAYVDNIIKATEAKLKEKNT